jgi:hypothetical protein
MSLKLDRLSELAREDPERRFHSTTSRISTSVHTASDPGVGRKKRSTTSGE